MNTISESGFDRVKRIAAGRWSKIIGDLYPDLAPALRIPGKTRCACPVHGSRKGAQADGFRVFNDFEQSGGGVCNTCGEFATGIDLICFLEGQSGKPKAALDILESYLGIDKEGKAKPRPLPAPKAATREDDDPKAIERRVSLLSNLWTGSLPLSSLADDNQAIRYLVEKRGIADLDLIKSQRNVRFDPCHYFAKSEHAGEPAVKFPAIVSMMHGATGQAVGLHRIYLDHGEARKAPVSEPKKILRRLEKTLNGAIRVTGRAPFTHHANVCEGLENGLSIAFGTGHSVFAAGYATLLAHWNPPSGVRFVTIWCDRDGNKAGINHALKLKERLTGLGIQSRILVPNFLSTEDEDWNDVLLKMGGSALATAYSGHSAQTTTH